MMVKEERIIELINGGVDGELSRRQAALLERLRAENPEVEAQFVEMAEIRDRVAGLASADPPGHLKSHILRSLPQHTRAAQPVRQNVLATVFGHLTFGLQARPALQLATVFIAGLVLGGVVMTVGPMMGTVDSSDVVGTIGSEGRPDATPASATALDGELFRGSVELRQAGDRITMTVAGRTTERTAVSTAGTAVETVLVEIAVLSGGTIPTGYADLADRSQAFRQTEVTVAADRIALRFAGESRVALDFQTSGQAREDASFVVTLRERGRVVATREVSI